MFKRATKGTKQSKRSAHQATIKYEQELAQQLNADYENDIEYAQQDDKESYNPFYRQYQLDRLNNHQPENSTSERVKYSPN